MKKTSTFLMVALLLTSAACSGYGSTGSSQPDTRMSGTAYVAGGPPPGIRTPLAKVNLTFSIRGRLVTQISADADGNYAVKIASGEYEVQPMSAMCPRVIRITVPRTLTATADIVCPIP